VEAGRKRVEAGGKRVEAGGKRVEAGGKRVEAGRKRVEAGGKRVEWLPGQETIRRAATAGPMDPRCLPAGGKACQQG